MGILLAIVFLSLAILSHGVISRFTFLKHLNGVIRFIIVGGFLGVFLLLTLYHFYGFDLEILSSLLIYSFLCELYIFIFTFTISSISANLIFNLIKKDLSMNEIEDLYSSHEMVKKRITRLVDVGYIQILPAGISITEKGARLVTFYSFFRSFFCHV